jgi:DNA helicase HerA-like ATPase
MIQTDASGKGMINILAADKLLHAPRLYATFLLWLLSELFEQLPEVGDLDKPKLLFFFDEAHLLFDEAPEALLDKIEQVVRIIRSKGVGVFFVTQNPIDIPDVILGQMGNRVQHALRAFTPRDQKAVRAAAETFRPNPAFKTETAITELGTGEALVSFLDDKGMPSMVERAFVLPPPSQIGPITPTEREAIVKGAPLFGHYEQQLDQQSAYEILVKRAQQAAADAGKAAEKAEALKAQEQAEAAAAKEAERQARDQARLEAFKAKELAKQERAAQKQAERQTRERERMLTGLLGALGTSAARSIGGDLGKSLSRGVLGGLFGSGSKK